MTEPTPQPAASAAAPLTEAEDKQWASFAHFGNILLLLPALIIYLVFKDRGPKVAVEGKEALNWTINVTALVIILNILSVIVSAVTFGIGGLLVGLLIWALLIVNLIFAILGGVKVNGGGSYRYPLNIRWIK
jgi:uncharacterized Tic20 family protein